MCFWAEAARGGEGREAFGEGFEGFCGGDVGVVVEEGEVEDGDVGEVEEGLLMLRDREAGGPTGTIREPNSTPMVTSCELTKRFSQRRIVSCDDGVC